VKATPTAKKSTEETTSTQAPSSHPTDGKKKSEKRLSRRSDRQNKTEDKTASASKKSVKNPTTKSAEKSTSDETDVKVHGFETPAVATPTVSAAPASAEVVSGKRERKRKKFWDEQECENAGFPVSGKPIKKHGQVHQQPHKTAVQVKNRRRLSTHVAGNDAVENSVSHKDVASEPASAITTTTASATTEPSPAKENGKLKYLMFDLTLEPRLIAEKMVEGVNIPGPGVPIPIDSSKLPIGWEKRVIQRGIGITKGKWDVFVQNSNGRSFR